MYTYQRHEENKRVQNKKNRPFLRKQNYFINGTGLCKSLLAFFLVQVLFVLVIQLTFCGYVKSKSKNHTIFCRCENVLYLFRLFPLPRRLYNYQGVKGHLTSLLAEFSIGPTLKVFRFVPFNELVRSLSAVMIFARSKKKKHYLPNHLLAF